MLLPTICVLLIVLICTITASYYYNREAFADIAATIDPRVESNTDSKTKKERINVRADYNGKERNFLRVFASMPSLSPADQRTFWVIGHDKNTGVSVVEANLIVTKDPNYVSANIPIDEARPWVGKILYIVPNGIQSTADAYASFIVPRPKNGVEAPKPTPVSPTVEISDTGFKAMELNKKSSMLNDIQQIVKNELLADRILDATVKNAPEKPKAEKPKAAPKKKSYKSCDRSYDDSCGDSCRNSCDNSYDDSCTDASNDSSSKIDMSQYIKKDQIPCWGCTIDY
jgi:hypothetical protein